MNAKAQSYQDAKKKSQIFASLCLKIFHHRDTEEERSFFPLWDERKGAKKKLWEEKISEVYNGLKFTLFSSSVVKKLIQGDEGGVATSRWLIASVGEKVLRIAKSANRGDLDMVG